MTVFLSLGGLAILLLFAFTYVWTGLSLLDEPNDELHQETQDRRH